VLFNLPESSACSRLEIGDPNDIHNGDKHTSAECDDENYFLFLRKSHASEDRHREEENSHISGKVNGRGGEVNRHNVGTSRRFWYWSLEDSMNRSALGNIEDGERKTSDIDDG